MASFYGNMKNNSRASFIFDKIYPSRIAMESALNKQDDEGTFLGDGIFINRYVLVDYHYALADTDDLINQNNIDEFYEIVNNSLVTAADYTRYFIRTIVDEEIKYIHPTSFSPTATYYQKKVFIDRYKPDNKIVSEELYLENENTENHSITNLSPYINSLIETDIYYVHKKADWEAYRANYDCTVWMKIYIDGKERYIMVAELNAEAPVLEIIDDAPGCYSGTAHFDARASTDLNYLYYIPKNWDIILNKYNPNRTFQLVTNLTIGDDISDSKYYNLIGEKYQLTDDLTVQEDKDYYKLLTTEDEYYYYEFNKNNNNLWYEQYVPTLDTQVKFSKNYYIVNYNIVEGLIVGQTIKNLHYYEKDIEDNFIATLDERVQENKNYYTITVNRQILDPGTDIASLGLYEENNINKTYDEQVEYPYFNYKGFDKRVSTHVNDIGQGIYINKVKSTRKYPQHRFVHAGALTKSTYLPNRYYTYRGEKLKIENPEEYEFCLDIAYYIGKTDNPTSYRYISIELNKDGKYIPSNSIGSDESYYYDKDLEHVEWFTKSIEWQQNTAYYELTWAVDENGNKIIDNDNDTYRIDMYFPEFGNSVADIYDVIYGSPVVVENTEDNNYNNFVGYCSTEQWANYIIKDDGEYWAANHKFDLTDEEFNQLSPELYPGVYDIPVYIRTGSNVRLYNDERMKGTLAPPYDNLDRDGEISVGWILTLLKRYLSELRYLSYGANGSVAGQGMGLQSDWTLEDDEAFGYIYHRPNLITNFVLTTDEEAYPNKDYYIESVQNGEVIYTKVTGLVAGDNIQNLSYFELPKSYLNNAEANNDVYVQCEANTPFDTNTEYYIKEGSRYVPAYWTQQNRTLYRINANSTEDLGLVSYQNIYTITMDNNDIITNRTYGCRAGTSSDSVALCYNGKAVKDLIIETKNSNSNDAPLIEDIQNINLLKRYEILEFLDDLTLNYNVDYSNNTDWTYYNTFPENDSYRDFCYATINVTTERLAITSAIFEANTTSFYTKSLVPVAKEDYEIHNIWNSVLEIVLREP